MESDALCRGEGVRGDVESVRGGWMVDGVEEEENHVPEEEERLGVVKLSLGSFDACRPCVFGGVGGCT